MSGKRRLSSTGKWLLDSTGKAKHCSCCGQGCCDYYEFRFFYTGAESCCAWDEVGYLNAGAWITPDAFTCAGDDAWNILWNYDGTSILGILTRSGSTLTLYAEISPVCDSAVITYAYELAIGDCIGGCLPAGTYNLPFAGAFPSDTTCNADMQVTITPKCCTCDGKCYILTVTDVTMLGECACETLATDILDDIQDEYDGGVFPVTAADCTVAGGISGTALACEATWAYETSWDTHGCPTEGTFTWPLIATSDNDPPDVCAGYATVEILEVSCCPLNENPGTPNYYISFDYEFHSYYDIDGNSVDCDGNPNGINLCNVVDSQTDMLMVASGGSTLWLDNGAWDPTVDCGAYDSEVAIDCIGGGEWMLGFELIYNASTIKVGGMTPVGVYPDINICFNDGFISYRLDVTNIVVTEI